jgi:predicted O-linked N-acetylglucosamine transferase (SPINDLY family)
MSRSEALLANDRGIALFRSGRRDEAIASFARAIELDPQYAEAHFNLGSALRRTGESEAAIASYRKALDLRPNLMAAHLGIGEVLSDLGRFAEAIAAFDRALALEPNAAVVHNNLSLALRKAGESRRALQVLDRAIALKPDYALAHGNRASVLLELGRDEEALDAMERALSLQPLNSDYLTSLVGLLRESGRAHQAVSICDQLVRAIPTHAEAFAELANSLLAAGDVDNAQAACARALTLNSRLAKAHNCLGNILRDQGRVEDAIGSFRTALDLEPDLAVVRSNLVFTMQFAPGYGSDALLQENLRWAELHEAPLLAHHRPHPNRRSKDRPLRVGYVSPYFRSHAAAFFLWPVLSHHDPAAVQVVCYSSTRAGDAITQKFKSLNHAWHDVAGLSDDALASQVRADEIDILVDTALHMEGTRLFTFARKPSPVQVTWLGYPGTTGLRSIDYRLTDPYLDPVGASEAVFSERTVRLPRTFWCYAPLGPTPPVSGLPAQRNGYVTFGCFNNFAKVTGDTMELWSRVLRAASTARLALLSPPGTHRSAVLDRFERSGVSADRIRFVPRVPPDDYLRLYNTVDLCLDTTPYPGHTTTIDALWMGVPVVTLAGQTTVGRGGVSILSNMELTSLIARTPDEYVDIAVATVKDLDALAGLRLGLRERLGASPLMNARQFTGDLEEAYARMWSDYCENA